MNAPKHAEGPLTPSLSPNGGRAGTGNIRFAQIQASGACGAPSSQKAHILVFTTVFPNEQQPRLGLFVRERMFRVAEHLPLTVVAPVPWFPFQRLIRRFRHGYRPVPPRREIQQGIEVHHPRFLSVPGLCRWADGLAMALCSLPTLLRLRRRFPFSVIDSHFAYPDGYAASLLGRWLNVPTTVTLRGTEVPLSRFPLRRRLMLSALRRADRVFSVSDSLSRHMRRLGSDKEILRIANGVDARRFFPESQAEARHRLGIPPDVKVLVSVGALCERKGFHRVIALLPALRERYPELVYLVVGGPSPEGDWTEQLCAQAEALGLTVAVRFTGPMEPDALRWPLSAADLFVLATRNEGWANVFLEAMVCGLPIVTTDVGGNREVVAEPELGMVAPFGDDAALANAIEEALGKQWDRDRILAWARENTWDKRVETLLAEFRRLSFSDAPQATSAPTVGESGR